LKAELAQLADGQGLIVNGRSFTPPLRGRLGAAEWVATSANY